MFNNSSAESKFKLNISAALLQPRCENWGFLTQILFGIVAKVLGYLWIL